MKKLTIEGNAAEDAVLNMIHSPIQGYAFKLLAIEGYFVINNFRLDLIEIQPSIRVFVIIKIIHCFFSQKNNHSYSK